jgi:hypothetical protein
MDEDMTSSLQKKAEQSRHQLSDLEERLQRLEQLKSRLSRLRETNQENMLLPNATHAQTAHAANTISNASLRNTHVVNVQHLTIEDVDDEMDANRDDTDYQVLLVYSAICLSTPTHRACISNEQNSERSPLVGLYGTPQTNSTLHGAAAST